MTNGRKLHFQICCFANGGWSRALPQTSLQDVPEVFSGVDIWSGMRSVSRDCSERDGCVCKIAPCYHGVLHNIRMTVVGVHRVVCIVDVLPTAWHVLNVGHLSEV